LWYIPVIPALRGWRQEDCDFKASLSYKRRPFLKRIKSKQNKKTPER
jgi:hypothetical protein